MKRFKKKKKKRGEKDEDYVPNLPEFDFLNEFDEDGHLITDLSHNNNNPSNADSGVFIDRLSSSPSSSSASAASFSSATNSFIKVTKLNHSAAKHRIAIRPVKNHARKRFCSQENDEKSIISAADQKIKLHHIFRRTKSLLVLEGGDNGNNQPNVIFSRGPSVVRRHSWTSSQNHHYPLPPKNNTQYELKSTLNANVIFRRCKTPSPQSTTPQSSISRTTYNTLNNKEKFLESIEHWTLANEGFMKSLWNLTEVKTMSEIGSMESLDSSMFMESVALVEFDSEDDDEDLRSGSQGAISAVTQCDAENTELEIAAKEQKQSLMCNYEQISDECENVNVREMRKVFLFFEPVIKVKVGAETSPNVNWKSCSDIRWKDDEVESASVVKALIMKFNDISSNPNSL